MNLFRQCLNRVCKTSQTESHKWRQARESWSRSRLQASHALRLLDCMPCLLGGSYMQGHRRSTLRATMYFDLRSLARYTLPNFPWPSGLPMSKSASCHLRSLLAKLAVC